MRRLIATSVAVLALAGCGVTAGSDPAASPPASPSAASEASPTPAASPSPTPTPTPSPTPRPSPTADAPGTVAGLGPVADLSDAELEQLGVNEIGRVLVSEWHKIGTDTDGSYQNTLETFREQLQLLYDRGYRPVTTREYTDGTFPIPAGTSPVLLTFDDTSPNHLQWAADGTPDPDSVVGILEDFAASHEGWRATGVFAYIWAPFGDWDDEDAARKLAYLVDNGFELSNHTTGHENLAELTSQEVQDQLGDNVAKVTALVPHAEVPTLTLPFGVHPEDRDLELSGTSSSGTAYEHDLVFEVGWMPDSSPHHVDHDPRSIMRVPAHGPWREEDLDWWDWLDWMEDEPYRRFVSDGDPDTVTYPAGFEEVAAVADGLPTRVYERAGS